MRKNWTETWMSVAHAVGERSACCRRQVGAVVVSTDQRIVSTGYNGPPAGFVVADGSNCLAYCPRAQQASQGIQVGAMYSNCVSVHAEANALIYADRHLYEGGTLYVTSSVCFDCAKLVANSGIGQVVMLLDEVADAHRNPYANIQFLEASGLQVQVVEA